MQFTMTIINYASYILIINYAICRLQLSLLFNESRALLVNVYSGLVQKLFPCVLRLLVNVMLVLIKLHLSIITCFWFYYLTIV